MPKARIINADVLDGLRSLEDESMQCCITSPPYWGLRDYGTAKWEGGDPDCDHQVSSGGASQLEGASQRGRSDVARGDCPRCGARRVDDQIGLEKTPEEYTDRLVAVFREVRRVLRTDGVCFLNLGDSYANDGKWGGATGGKHANGLHGEPVGRAKRCTGLKPKDLVGIPWRVAFALQADGWWLRRDIIWNKPNPMPESPTDRPTSSHEYVFILTKSARYLWDQEAVRERGTGRAVFGNSGPKQAENAIRSDQNRQDMSINLSGRNIRSVWTIPTAPFPGEFCTACTRFYADGGRHLAVHRNEETEKETKICACGRWDAWISHFACFPQTLVEPMIKAGTSEKGCCPGCGAPWERVVERTAAERDDSGRTHSLPEQRMGKTPPPEKGWESERRTIGFRPTCECGVEPVPCTALDPFSGAGTTGLVALKLGRDFVGVELNPDYAEMARKRIYQDAPLFNEVELSKVGGMEAQCE